MKQELKEIRNQLTDAPVKVKSAFNELVKYLNELEWKEYLRSDDRKYLFVSDDINTQKSHSDEKRYNHRQGVMRYIKQNLPSINCTGTEKNYKCLVKDAMSKGFTIVMIPADAWDTKELMQEFLTKHGMN